MARPPRVLIAGGYGTFGRLLARELLATTDARLVIAGRNLERATAACRELVSGAQDARPFLGSAAADLSERHAPLPVGAELRVEPLALDLADRAQLARVAGGCFAVACTAGPFQALDPALVRPAVESGVHWLDIADDPAWVRTLLHDSALDAAARAAGVTLLPGQSSVPALSGALARWCLARTPGAQMVRVTLGIGNRNRKGVGAVASVLQAGLYQPVAVKLPWGQWTAYRFGANDATLLEEELGVPAEFRVAFEWKPAGWVTAQASRVAGKRSPQKWLAPALAALAAPLGWFGSSGGCVQAEAWDRAGRRTFAALLGEDQRLAVLPCALAIEALLRGELPQRGVVRPWDWLPPDEWVQRLSARGLRFTTG